MSTPIKDGQTRGGMRRVVPRQGRKGKPLTDDERRAVARDLVATMSIKGVAYTHGLAYSTVYNVFVSSVVVKWELASTELVQTSFDWELPQ